MTKWALFGGAGFIGQHLARSILISNFDDRVTILDIRIPDESESSFMIGEQDPGRIELVPCDVRQEAEVVDAADQFDIIVNLAAIHREPGHRAHEYFDTNVDGARNVCLLADRVGCRELIFTSSISVYGIHNTAVDETTQPSPYSPYGQSKLAAEAIYQAWAGENGTSLIIIRPGVVFGKSENGNVTRLVREMLNRDRRLQLEPDQAKAGIYVEELLALMQWLRTTQPTVPDGLIVNGVSNENLSFNSFGDALGQIHPFSHDPLVVNQRWMKLAAAITQPFGRVTPSTFRFHPKRLKKLTLANDVRATRAEQLGYPYAWPLTRALSHWLEQGL